MLVVSARNGMCLCRIKDKIEIDGKDGEGGITAVESKRNNSERMG